MRFFILILCLFINSAIFGMEMESVKKNPLKMTTEEVESEEVEPLIQEINYEPMIQSPESLVMQKYEDEDSESCCSSECCLDKKEAVGVGYCCGGAATCCGSTIVIVGASVGSSIVAAAGLALAAAGFCVLVGPPVAKKCVKCCKETFDSQK